MRRITTAATMAVALFGPWSLAQAADHADSPAVQTGGEPAADITDVFAWTTSDASKMNLIMNTTGDVMHSDAVQYAFHLTRADDAPGLATGAKTDVICQFDSGEIACWVGGDEYVRGDASAEAGLSSTSGKTKVFAGPRNDPFFMNFSGFVETLDVVKGALPVLGPTLNAAGCPEGVDGATSAVLVDQLQKQNAGQMGAAEDDFAAGTVLALVVQIDKSLIVGSGDVLAVWASTNRR